MAVIYHVAIEDDDDLGEFEAFFDSAGKYLHGWHANDADYRHEYMDPLMAKLGIEVRMATATQLKTFIPAIKKALKL